MNFSFRATRIGKLNTSPDIPLRSLTMISHRLKNAVTRRLHPYLPYKTIQALELRRQHERMRESEVEPHQAVLGLKDRSLFELFPGIEEQEVSLPPAQFYRPANMVLPLPEFLSLAAICRFRAPRRIFEIGTYLGSSTAIMAQNTPATTELWTLDLSEQEMQALNLDFAVGRDFVGTRHAAKITQLRGDSRKFDFSPYKGKMDLVFVDANHAYPFVKFDTQVAFDLLAPGGIIIWDDYVWGDYPECAGVARHLNELHLQKPIYHLAHTRLAIHLDAT